MRIAIIGGGASGVVAAHLLGEAHSVTLIEREPVLGGNIRTLNRNVACTRVPGDLRLDAGVIEFARDRSPAFHALLRELDVERGEVPGTSALHLADGRSFVSPGALRLAGGRLERFKGLARLLPLAASRARFLRRTAAASPAELTAAPLGRYLDRSVFSLWARLLMMYAYSIPAAAVDACPAALAVPSLRRHLDVTRWTRIRGGVFVYVERILERFAGEVLLGARVASVRRGPDAVLLTMDGGETLRFDAVVFATTPDQVLALLADPSAAEGRRFAAWKARPARVVVHTDEGLYRRRRIRYPSEFDLVETASGAYGYNAYLNRLTGLPERAPRYQLAFGLKEEIEPEHVVHVQNHTTPSYSVEAFRHRDEVSATNGENRTWHAGAYLGDGLHEGAVRSAAAVSERLGGRELRY